MRKLDQGEQLQLRAEHQSREGGQAEHIATRKDGHLRKSKVHDEQRAEQLSNQRNAEGQAEHAPYGQDRAEQQQVGTNGQLSQNKRDGQLRTQDLHDEKRAEQLGSQRDGEGRAEQTPHGQDRAEQQQGGEIVS